MALFFCEHERPRCRVEVRKAGKIQRNGCKKLTARCWSLLVVIVGRREPDEFHCSGRSVFVAHRYLCVMFM